MFAISVLLAAATAAPADKAFCDRQMKKFEENERAMAFDYDFERRLKKIESDLYEKTGDRRHSLAALEHQRKIVADWKSGEEKADTILSLMIAAKCKLPDHEASPLTYSKTKDLASE